MNLEHLYTLLMMAPQSKLVSGLNFRKLFKILIQKGNCLVQDTPTKIQLKGLNRQFYQIKTKKKFLIEFGVIYSHTQQKQETIYYLHPDMLMNTSLLNLYQGKHQIYLNILTLDFMIGLFFWVKMGEPVNLNQVNGLEFHIELDH